MTVMYEVIGVDRGKATIASNIDMKINIVPLAIMELVSKSICSNFLDNVMKCS